MLGVELSQQTAAAGDKGAEHATYEIVPGKLLLPKAA